MSSLISPSNIRPMTSSQSPNNARNASTTYAKTTNSTRSGVPATAIGGSRIHPPPLQTTSFNHASSMPFSPMGENTTSFLPSTTTNTRKHTKNKFQFTPTTTTGQSI